MEQEANVKPRVMGRNVNIIRPVNLYDCELGDDVFIGPFVEIQSECKVGARSRIQSHSFLCSYVSLGEDCFVGHGVMFVNDKFLEGGPAKGDTSKWLHTNIGSGVSIGSNATILPVEIIDGCVIGAGAVVTKNIDVRGVYAGNPAKLIKKL